MAAPIMSWWSGDNTTPMSTWPIGKLDAGYDSAEYQFLVWNNKGGSADVADAVNCYVTTKDINGGNGVGTNADQLVSGKWVKVCCSTNGLNPALPVSWYAIGGDVKSDLKAADSLGGVVTPAKTICGKANDGNMLNFPECFARLYTKVSIPSDAIMGKVDFLVRVGYQHI